MRDLERISGGNVDLEGPRFLNSRKISNERFPVQLTSQLEDMHFIIMREIWQTNLGKARTDCNWKIALDLDIRIRDKNNKGI